MQLCFDCVAPSAEGDWPHAVIGWCDRFAEGGGPKLLTASLVMQVRDGKSTFDCDAPNYDLSAFKPLEMKAGSMVVLHGANVHFSKENSSPKSRHAYSVHYVERDAGWPAENW